VEIRDILLQKHPNPPLHGFEDLRLMAVATVMTFGIKQLLYYTLDNSVNKRLALSNYPDHLQRLERIHDYIFGTWFYGLSIIFSYYFYWGSPNIPDWIGGSGKAGFFLDNWPDKAEPYPYLEYYYPIQMGYHLHNLLFQIICRTHKKTYIEMVLHHALTFVLIYYSYFSCLETFGVTVLMVHDVGDFIMNTGKVVRDLELAKGKIIDAFYVGIVLSFLYPRVFVAWFCYIPPGLTLMFPEEWKMTGIWKRHPMKYLDYSSYTGFWF